MPYKNNEGLPDGVKDSLPDAAQNIFRRAYNAVEKSNPKYTDERKARIAWQAVKGAGWKKKGDNWVKETLSLRLKVQDYMWDEGVTKLVCSIDSSDMEHMSLNTSDYESQDNLILSNIEKYDDLIHFTFLVMNEQLSKDRLSLDIKNLMFLDTKLVLTNLE